MYPTCIAPAAVRAACQGASPAFIALPLLALRPRKERILELYQMQDKNGSGKLSVTEFAAFFKKVLQDVQKKDQKSAAAKV